MTRLAVLALVALAITPLHQAAPQELDFVPVGVRYSPDDSPTRRAIDLDAIRRARFNVTAAPDTIQQMTALTRIDRPAAAGPPLGIAIRSTEIGTVPVFATTPADNVKEGAWTLFASGVRGVVFDDWAGLQQNPAALAEASAFAETITRNMALYAPLRRVQETGARAIAIAGSENYVEAHWLESSEAMLLIAVNHGAETRHVTLNFPADIPEAVWQNMLSGGSVNFVAGPTGPFYEHDFGAHDVLVLTIRKRWR